MKKNVPITTLFLDVGGVLLTNGWDHLARRRAAKYFKLNWADMQERHELNFEIHEEDKITFKEYLDRVVFWRKRPFTRAAFRQFMFAQSQPAMAMIDLVRDLKAKYRLKVIVVSNEAREVNAYRSDACPADCVYRQHSIIRSDRGSIWDARLAAYRFQNHFRKIGCVRIETGIRRHPCNLPKHTS